MASANRQETGDARKAYAGTLPNAWARQEIALVTATDRLTSQDPRPLPKPTVIDLAEPRPKIARPWHVDVVVKFADDAPRRLHNVPKIFRVQETNRVA